MVSLGNRGCALLRGNGTRRVFIRNINTVGGGTFFRFPLLREKPAWTNNTTAAATTTTTRASQQRRSISTGGDCGTTGIPCWSSRFDDRELGRVLGCVGCGGRLGLGRVSFSDAAFGRVRRALSSSSSSAAAEYSDEENGGGNDVPFLLADIGEGIKEVELLQWYVEVGDVVQQFDKVCEVQSDKATVEITSRYDGAVTKLNGDVGDMVQVGDPLLFLITSDSSSSSSSQPADVQVADDDDDDDAPGGRMLQDTETQPIDDRLSIPTVASRYHLQDDDDDDDDIPRNGDATKHGGDDGAGPTYRGKTLTSPAVRKLGKEYGVDLSTIQPSGPKGRLLKSDVLTYLREHGQKPHEAQRQEQHRVERPPEISPPIAASAAGTTEFDESGSYEIVQLKGYHRLMIGTMTASLQIPHMCFGDEIVMNKLIECRKELKGRRHRDDGGSDVGMLAFFIKACSLSLSEYPALNGSVHDVERGEMKLHKNHDIGIAMDTPRGLIVPVVRRANHKSLREIQDDIDRLKGDAKQSRVSQEDLVSPTFTLSNIGSIGGTYMNPVIVPPQVGIGAMGSIKRVPKFVPAESSSSSEDPTQMQVYEAHVMNISWSADHRFVDGATLARFNESFKTYLENPMQMLVHLK